MDAANSLLARSVRAERDFLAASFILPIAAHTASIYAGLRGDHFTSNEHSFVFAYGCLSVEAGRTPSIQECIRLSRSASDVDLERADLLYLPDLDDAERPWSTYSDLPEGMIDLFAAAVRDFAERRAEAQVCLQRFTQLAAPDDFLVDVRPRLIVHATAKVAGATARVRTSRGTRRVHYA